MFSSRGNRVFSIFKAFLKRRFDILNAYMNACRSLLLKAGALISKNRKAHELRGTRPDASGESRNASACSRCVETMSSAGQKRRLLADPGASGFKAEIPRNSITRRRQDAARLRGKSAKRIGIYRVTLPAYFYFRARSENRDVSCPAA